MHLILTRDRGLLAENQSTELIKPGPSVSIDAQGVYLLKKCKIQAIMEFCLCLSLADMQLQVHWNLDIQMSTVTSQRHLANGVVVYVRMQFQIPKIQTAKTHRRVI